MKYSTKMNKENYFKWSTMDVYFKYGQCLCTHPGECNFYSIHNCIAFVYVSLTLVDSLFVVLRIW